ncbi:N-acetylmuramoyl-L-alanine amidase [Polymorphobacter sp.]|uniref:N-acetylmuramoyl-L-alanine amidase n=1 Tax=Polymorphobacter sp. TaxID=1909290 RepID=UPI003F6EA8E0
MTLRATVLAPLAAFLLAAFWLVGAARAAALLEVSIVPGTVTIRTDGPVAGGWTLALAAPDRLVIDLPAVVSGPTTVAGVASVQQLRLAAFQPGVARLVMDLSAPVVLVAAEASERQLVLTLRRATAAEFGNAVKAGRRPMFVRRAPGRLDVALAPAPVAASPPASVPAPAAAPAPPKLPEAVVAAAAAGAPVVPAGAVAVAGAGATGGAQTEAGAALPDASTPVQPRPPAAEPVPDPTPLRRQGRGPGVKPRSGSTPLVVLDAGHGGKDVGAISVRGGYEKAVTLAIARETARQLKARGRVRVRLTREDDRFIPLGGRVQIARDARADLFVSIHADAALNQEARGASVYTLSAVASDAVAAQLAARENKADIIGGLNLGIDAPEVGDIMIELSRRATGNVSVSFAEMLQEELSSRIRFRSQFHHFAGFRVLKAPDVPSVLLETGYVSNGEDSDFLFSTQGQRTVAQGIARAIERHLLGE